jgi:hypothetical protein
MADQTEKQSSLLKDQLLTRNESRKAFSRNGDS